jgi:Icc-related predicted phosphoesterase
MKLDKEDIEAAKEVAKVLRESKVDELVVAGNLITVLLAEREQQQRAWVGLTDEEVVECWARPNMFHIAHAIEAKLKEKNGIAPQGSDT